MMSRFNSFAVPSTSQKCWCSVAHFNHVFDRKNRWLTFTHPDTFCSLTHLDNVFSDESSSSCFHVNALFMSKVYDFLWALPAFMSTNAFAPAHVSNRKLEIVFFTLISFLSAGWRNFFDGAQSLADYLLIFVSSSFTSCFHWILFLALCFNVFDVISFIIKKYLRNTFKLR